MSTSFTEPLFEGSSNSPSAYALALYSGLWAFDGWDQANYVGGEVKNPEKNIPRTIHLSMVLVLVSETNELGREFLYDPLPGAFLVSQCSVLCRLGQGMYIYYNSSRANLISDN